MRCKRTVSFLLMLAVLPLALWAGGQGESASPAALAEGENSNPLSDYRVRQAIAYAIDMDAIAETLLEGKAIVADSLVPNGPWKIDGLNSYGYNPEKAKALLSEAGWDSSYTLDIVYYYGDQLTVDIMTAVQSYLQAVGMKASFRKLEGDVGGQLWTAPSDPIEGPSVVKWDLAYAGSAALAMHEYYGKFPTGGAGNSHTPGKAELDQLIEATAASADPEVQKAAFYDLQKYMNHNLPAIPLYYQQLFIYESDRLERPSDSYGNAQYAYDWELQDWDLPASENGKKVLYTNTAPVEFFEHPWFNPGVFFFQKVLFDRLIVVDPGFTEFSPQLAEEYSVSDDSLELSFQIRDGAKWHDGSPVTAEDVRWSIEYALQVPAIHSVFSNTFHSIQGADAFVDGDAEHISGIAIEGSTLTISFSKIDPNMLLTFSQWPPLPKAYFEGTDPLQFQQNPYWQQPVGSGPFMLDEIEMNDYTTLVPFTGHYGKKPKIDEIIMYPSGENDANVVKNAEAGRLDYGFTKNVGDVKSLEAMDSMNIIPVDIPYTRLFYVNKFPKP